MAKSKLLGIKRLQVIYVQILQSDMMAFNGECSSYRPMLDY